MNIKGRSEFVNTNELRFWACVSALAIFCTIAASETRRADLMVYGATSAGISAAVQGARMGLDVVVVGPDRHLGGLTAGGLGWTDSGRKAAVGGFAREFYRRLKAHYDHPEAWQYQQPQEYSRYDPNGDAMWVFEPHVAEAAFEAFVAEYQIPVYRDEWLDRTEGVDKDGTRITEIRMESGNAYRGALFIDATYEGDLMAAAGISYHVGREGNEVYGETLNGVQTQRAVSHQFEHRVDPYVVPGDPSSGLLPRVHDDGPGPEGSGDRRVQAYCYRLCLTQVPENRMPFERPQGYDPLQYELLARYLQTGWEAVFNKFDPVPNAKTDTNNHGAFSTDNIGMNYGYPEGTYEERAAILKEHVQYQKGWLWFMANDPRVPGPLREEFSRWGLAKDEFADNGNWPHQIYVREARRMIGEFVMTEGHLRGQRDVTRPVGLGSYNMDSHNVQRYVARDRAGIAIVRNEGDIQISPNRVYAIDYGALVPRKTEATNLLVPVCLSSSHIAYGSIRMEPVFMILGQSAATAAALALEKDAAVQDVDYPRLAQRLDADGQVLSLPNPR